MRDSQIFSCISIDTVRKAAWNTAYKERMHKTKVTGLATSANMLRASQDKPSLAPFEVFWELEIRTTSAGKTGVRFSRSESPEF
jgi:hypothetical protein